MLHQNRYHHVPTVVYHAKRPKRRVPHFSPPPHLRRFEVVPIG
jgi:hypothetical protein